MLREIEKYKSFINQECKNCSFYVSADEINKNVEICLIEEKISFSRFFLHQEGEKIFPYEWLDESNTDSVYICRKRIGLSPRKLAEKRLKNKIIDAPIEEVLKLIMSGNKE